MPVRSEIPLWRTALVTGASSGIGEALARRLAQRGTDLVLVARRIDRLHELAVDLRASSGREVEVIGADLADQTALATIEARMTASDRPVELLVNNAGFGTRGDFASMPLAEEDREIHVNLLAPVRLTRAALPGMLQRGHGGVINMSSIAGLQPIPYWATYAATKAYLNSFSIALHEEVKSRGVRVVAVMPGFTRTEFQAGENLGVAGIPDVFWSTADQVAVAALRALDRGRATCVPGLQYRLLSMASRMTPWSISRRLTRAGGGRILALLPEDD